MLSSLLLAGEAALVQHVHFQSSKPLRRWCLHALAADMPAQPAITATMHNSAGSGASPPMPAMPLQVPHPVLVGEHSVAATAPRTAALRAQGINSVSDLLEPTILAQCAPANQGEREHAHQASLGALAVGAQVWEAAQAWQLASEAQISNARHACMLPQVATAATTQEVHGEAAQAAQFPACTHIPVKIEQQRSCHVAADTASSLHSEAGHMAGDDADHRRPNAGLAWPDTVQISTPAAAGPVLLRALAHAGAVVVGEAEWRHTRALCGVPTFPYDWPTTAPYWCAPCPFALQCMCCAAACAACL